MVRQGGVSDALELAKVGAAHGLFAGADLLEDLDAARFGQGTGYAVKLLRG